MLKALFLLRKLMFILSSVFINYYAIHTGDPFVMWFDLLFDLILILNYQIFIERNRKQI